jgi:hypothetical protein
MVSARSSLANSLIGVEAGYLLQDAVVLTLEAWLRSRARGRLLMRELVGRVLVLHHACVGGALGLYQWYVARGLEKGAWVILLFMLMNAS